jgi:uncharacterized protein YgiM (DUF1202 family)
MLLTNISFAQEQNSLWRKKDVLILIVGGPFIELHTGPGRGYAKFHAVEKNERLRVIKTRTDWYKVETQDGKKGWVSRSALKNTLDAQGYPLDFSPPNWKDVKDPWQFGLLTGDLDGAISYTLLAGYRLTPNISAEIKYVQGFGEFSSAKSVSAMLLHQPFPQWRASPFFTLGAGTMKVYPDTVLVEAEDQQDNSVIVGAGLQYFLSHRVIARLEYNHHTLLTTRDNNLEVEEWKAGFSVLF